MHLGLQGSWSETQFLVEGPDFGHIVAYAACRRKVVGEVDDEQAHSGNVWIDEAEMIMIAELHEGLCLLRVVSGCAWAEGMSR